MKEKKKQVISNAKYYYLFEVNKYEFIVILNNSYKIIFINMNDSNIDISNLEQINSNNDLREQFKAYFLGAKKKFNIDYQLEGTNFQKKVWQALEKVPYGETITYSELAKRSGNEKAVRATATAVANNPIVIIIPCHRVIRKNGSIGEYSAGGPTVKKHLLEIEKSLMK